MEKHKQISSKEREGGFFIKNSYFLNMDRSGQEETHAGLLAQVFSTGKVQELD